MHYELILVCEQEAKVHYNSYFPTVAVAEYTSYFPTVVLCGQQCGHYTGLLRAALQVHYNIIPSLGQQDFLLSMAKFSMLPLISPV